MATWTKYRVTAIAAALAVVLLVAAVAFVGQSFEIEDRSPLTPQLEFLIAGHYQDAEDFFGGVQRRYEVGEATEDELYRSLQLFRTTRASLVQHLSKWVESYPTSYSARIIRSFYYRHIAEQKRGEDFRSETPWYKLYLLDKYLDLAEDDARESLHLSPKPYLSFLNLLNIGMHRGTDEENRKILDEALAVEPGGFLVRRRYMLTLRPRWGGSFASMRAYLDESKVQNIAEPHLRVLEAEYIGEKAHVDEMGHRYEAALQGYRQAAALVPTNLVPKIPGENFWVRDQYLLGVVRCANSIKRLSDVRAELDELAARNTSESYVYSYRGYLYETEGKTGLAYAEYVRAADLNDAWAKSKIGRQ